jgi:hypothetical protein
MPTSASVNLGALVKLPVACRLTGLWIATTNTTNITGNISVQTFVNGALGGPSLTIPNASGPTVYTATGTIAVPAGQGISVQILNPGTVTTSLGQCSVGVLIALN